MGKTETGKTEKEDNGTAGKEVQEIKEENWNWKGWRKINSSITSVVMCVF